MASSRRVPRRFRNGSDLSAPAAYGATTGAYSGSHALMLKENRCHTALTACRISLGAGFAYRGKISIFLNKRPTLLNQQHPGIDRRLTVDGLHLAAGFANKIVTPDLRVEFDELILHGSVPSSFRGSVSVSPVFGAIAFFKHQKPGLTILEIARPAYCHDVSSSS
jgi:hypothetical protein